MNAIAYLKTAQDTIKSEWGKSQWDPRGTRAQIKGLANSVNTVERATE